MLEVELDGTGDGWFHVSDAFGPLLEVDDGYTGVEYGAVELITSGAHFLQVEMASGDASSFELSSNVRLKPINDPDDGRAVSVGNTYAGSIDHYSDWDWYAIRLMEGETVRISTDSFNVDTFIYVDFPGSRNNQLVYDDDSGGGLGGTNAELVYRAPHTGEYIIAVADAVGDGFGGYYLSIETAREGTETVSVPPSPETLDSPFGTMVVFEDPLSYFSIQVPEAWTELQADETYGEIFSAYDLESEGAALAVWEDVLALGLGRLTLSEYADLIESTVFVAEGAEEITREAVRTAQGLHAIKLQGAFFGARTIRFIYMSDDHVAFNLSYAFSLDQWDMGKRLAVYSFDSFRVN